jgi:hypothetical protein
MDEALRFSPVGIIHIILCADTCAARFGTMPRI